MYITRDTSIPEEYPEYKISKCGEGHKNGPSCLVVLTKTVPHSTPMYHWSAIDATASTPYLDHAHLAVGT